MVADENDQFDRAVDRFSKTALAGSLLGLPVVVLAAVGASTAVMLGYLVVVVIVLAVLVVSTGPAIAEHHVRTDGISR